MKKDKVAESLKEIISIRENRNAEYGDATKIKGDVMKALFPSGLYLNTELDFARFGILNFIVSKLIRETNNFSSGGHEDSLDDIAVYSQILKIMESEK